MVIFDFIAKRVIDTEHEPDAAAAMMQQVAKQAVETKAAAGGAPADPS